MSNKQNLSPDQETILEAMKETQEIQNIYLESMNEHRYYGLDNKTIFEELMKLKRDRISREDGQDRI